MRIAGPVHTYPDIFKSATFSLRIQKFPLSHVIGLVADLFSILESRFKTEAVCGKKKLQIQKYPDTC